MAPKKKRDTSRKRTEILAAAARAFTEEGFDNTSMDRIAEVAGASKRTLYNHFESKEALFSAVIEDFLGRAKTLKQIDYRPDLPLVDQLERFADAKLSLLNDPDWVGVMKVGLGVLIRDPEMARATMERAYGGQDTLVAWLEAADRDGRLSVPDPPASASLFWSSVSGAFFWPHLLGIPPGLVEGERLRTLLLHSFLAAHGSSREHALPSSPPHEP